jgi:hypothetical protein
LNNVGVLQPPQRFGFKVKPSHGIGVAQRAVQHHFQRHFASKRFLLGTVNNSHATLAENS